MIHDAVHSHTSSLSISRSVSLTLSSVLFDLLDSDGALVVALGSEAEDENAGDYGTDQRRRNGDLPPPTAPMIAKTAVAHVFMMFRGTV